MEVFTEAAVNGDRVLGELVVLSRRSTGRRRGSLADPVNVMTVPGPNEDALLEDSTQSPDAVSFAHPVTNEDPEGECEVDEDPVPDCPTVREAEVSETKAEKPTDPEGDVDRDPDSK